MWRCSCRKRSAASETPGNGRRVGERGVGPRLRPVGADEHHRALGNPAVRGLPPLDVLDREVVPGRLGDLVHDGDHDQRPDGEGRRQLVDGRIVGVPVGGRIELGAELIGGEHVAGGLEPVLVPAVRLPGLGIHGRSERRVPEAGPDRNGRRDRVGQVHVLGARERIVIDPPERRPAVTVVLRAGGRGGADVTGAEARERSGQQQADGDRHGPAVASSWYGRRQRRRHEAAESLEDDARLQLGERGLQIGADILAIDVHSEAYRGARLARERQGGFRAFVRRQPKHQAGGATAQSVLDARRVPLGREPLRPISKQRHGYSAKRRIAVVPGVLVVAGPLFGRRPGRRHVLSMLCDYPGKLVTVVSRHVVHLEKG